MEQSEAIRALLGGADVWNAWATKASSIRVDDQLIDLRGISADGWNFSGYEFYAVSFSRSSLVKANFEGATLEYVDFLDCRLDGATFRGAQMGSITFQRSKLSGTSFENSELYHVDFVDTNFLEAEFDQAFVIDSKVDTVWFTELLLSGYGQEGYPDFRLRLKKADVDEQGALARAIALRGHAAQSLHGILHVLEESTPNFQSDGEADSYRELVAMLSMAIALIETQQRTIAGLGRENVAARERLRLLEDDYAEFKRNHAEPTLRSAILAGVKSGAVAGGAAGALAIVALGATAASQALGIDIVPTLNALRGDGK